MHSRIIQLTKNKSDYFIKESDYYDHWFTHSIADYVCDGTDTNEDIEWLLSSCNGALRRGKDKIIVVDKTLYFKNNYKGFVENLKKLQNLTFEDFCNRFDGMYALNDCYEDKFGFYIEDNGELHTLDKFMRHVKNGDEFYIGGTLDYHF